ncbi:MAG: xanthine dehydrogenase family protein molybdopterin-binding subunit [Steroidobacteraceae bacterium]
MSAEIADHGRREFLGKAAALGGGLVLALSLPVCARKRAVNGAAGGGEITAWLQISADNAITILVDRSEMGQGVYTALPMLLAEELEVSIETIKVIAAPVGDAYINAGNGGQITGTSNSVSDAWEKLRTAGAQARVVLIAAAAAHWGVSTAECRASNGHIVNAHGKTLSFGELAEAAAKLPLPKDVKLKDASRFILIGKAIARIDTPGKVDGSAEFGIDVKLPGMLYAALAQPPVLGGKASRVDSTAAERLPGVHRVLSTPSGVVVVAEHFWQALQAREALKIVWDPGPSAKLDNAAIRSTLHKALAAGAGASARADGNAAATLKAAHQTLSAVYELPMLAHATMEPMNCTADVKAGRCDLYVGTQVQKISQTTAAAAAGLAPEQVRVYTTLLGGGFGRRLEVDFIPAAVAASKAVGAPVKLIWTREDDMTHDYYRPPATLQLRGALDAHGELQGFEFHSVSPSITARFAPDTTDPFDSVVEGVQNYPYGVPNVAINYTRQEVGLDVGYLRSVSHAINCFGVESFMDELAAAAGKGPFEFRHGLLKDKPRHRRVLEAAATKAAWGRAPDGRYQGIALMEGYTTVIAQVAEISIDEGEPKIHKIVCVVDCGQIVNPRIVESQIESGIVFGLSAALWGEVTISAGKVRQTNFNSYRVLRSDEMPQIEVVLIESEETPGGIGEPAVALVAPAVCNAIFAATGKRVRALPIAAQKLFKA